jgi:hypothetical protein
MKLRIDNKWKIEGSIKAREWVLYKRDRPFLSDSDIGSLVKAARNAMLREEDTNGKDAADTAAIAVDAKLAAVIPARFI